LLSATSEATGRQDRFLHQSCDWLGRSAPKRPALVNPTLNPTVAAITLNSLVGLLEVYSGKAWTCLPRAHMWYAWLILNFSLLPRL